MKSFELLDNVAKVIRISYTLLDQCDLEGRRGDSNTPHNLNAEHLSAILCFGVLKIENPPMHKNTEVFAWIRVFFYHSPSCTRADLKTRVFALDFKRRMGISFLEKFKNPEYDFGI